MRKLLVSQAPHIHGSDTTQKLMRDVMIALAPTLLVSAYFFGFSAIKLVLIGAGTCIAVEFLIQKYLLRTKICINDYSAALTGVLLALNLPPSAPWWVMLIGSIIAIGVAKMTFGGLGQNIFNPALVGRVFLLVSFPVIMTDWTVPSAWLRDGVDAFTGATPLAIVKDGLAQGMSISEIFAANPNLTYSQMLFTKMGGSVGEVSALALILGFIYLLVRKVIRPHIPFAIIGSMLVLSAIFWVIDSQSYTDPIFNVLTGGVLLGSIFMATDYATSPMDTRGMILYGVGIGVLTVLIRLFGSYPEGISFAILIMNAAVPLINKSFKPRKFGMEVKNG